MLSPQDLEQCITQLTGSLINLMGEYDMSQGDVIALMGSLVHGFCVLEGIKTSDVYRGYLEVAQLTEGDDC